MPKPSIRRSLERALGKGQAGQGDGMIPGIDRVRDAGSKNPRTGAPWPSPVGEFQAYIGTWHGPGYWSQYVDGGAGVSSSVYRADFDEIPSPPSNTHGMATLTPTVALWTPGTETWAPETADIFNDYRNGTTRAPLAWAFASGPADTHSWIGIPDVGATNYAGSPMIFHWDGENWPGDEGAGCGIPNGTAYFGWTLNLWVPGYFSTP